MKRISLILAAALATFNANAADSLTMADFVYTNKLQVAGYTGTETLQNFPVLVRISTNLGDFQYSRMRSQKGGDLAFFAADGTKLASEVDTWTTSGTSLVWVKLPSMTQGTMFYMCYRLTDGLAALVVVDGDGRYRRNGHFAQQLVVVHSQDGHILGHAQPCRCGCCDDLLCAAVVYAEDRRRTGKRLQPPRQPLRLQRKVVLLVGRRRRVDAGGESVLRQLFAESLSALSAPEGGLGRPDVCERTVAALNEVPRRSPPLLRVFVDERHHVARHVRKRTGKRRLDENGRNPGGDEVPPFPVVQDVGDYAAAVP